MEFTRKSLFSYIIKVFPVLELPIFVLVFLETDYSFYALGSLIAVPVVAILFSKLTDLDTWTGLTLTFIAIYILHLNIYLSIGLSQYSWLMAATAIAAAFIFSRNKVYAFAVAGIFIITPTAIFYYLGAEKEQLLLIAVTLVFFTVLDERISNYLLLQQNELTKQSNIVKLKNKEITDSIAYAKRIQSAILPPLPLVKQNLKNSFILYKPKDIVAGDFYWMENVNGTIYFAAADCTGHGVPGAMVSVICNGGLNRSVREFGLTDTGKILDKTRELVIQEFEKSEEEVRDGMDIALCKLDGKTISYSGAYNPLWIIRDGEVLETKADRQPIGKFSKKKPFTTHSVDLKKGDSIYVFTDGFMDQFGGEEGKKYKSDRFKKFLISIQDHHMEAQYDLLEKEFENWRRTNEQLDDVCVIGVKIE